MNRTREELSALIIPLQAQVEILREAQRRSQSVVLQAMLEELERQLRQLRTDYFNLL